MIAFQQRDDLCNYNVVNKIGVCSAVGIQDAMILFKHRKVRSNMKSQLIISFLLLVISVGYCKEDVKSNKINTESFKNESDNNLIVKINSSIPEFFKIRQNYPNPFNATTTIEYELPNQATTWVAIYNTLGQKVKTLENQIKEAGRYVLEWDGKNSFGQDVASGIYFYVVLADEYYGINKMVLLK